MNKERTIYLEPGETITITNAPPVETPKIFSIGKGAKFIDVHRSTLYRAEQAGKITFDRTGKSPKVTQSELLKFKTK